MKGGGVPSQPQPEQILFPPSSSMVRAVTRDGQRSQSMPSLVQARLALKSRINTKVVRSH